jgi:hypothetical protein
MKHFLEFINTTKISPNYNTVKEAPNPINKDSILT